MTTYTYRLYETTICGKNVIALDILFNTEWFRDAYAVIDDADDINDFCKFLSIIADGNEIITVAPVDDTNIRDSEAIKWEEA